MNCDEQTIREWRELGFYYQRDESIKQWWLMGSKSGLSKFLDYLQHYSNNTSLRSISEHIHLGPHNYLEIMTWHKPLISNHAIAGNLADIARLKTIISNKLLGANAGEIFEIGSDYAPDSEYTIKFFVMADSFDPGSIE